MCVCTQILYSRKVTINSNIPCSSRQRRRELGKELEGPNNVTWVGDWEPNKKYVKIIHLKNTSLNLLKVPFITTLFRLFCLPIITGEVYESINADFLDAVFIAGDQASRREYKGVAHHISAGRVHPVCRLDHP